MAMLVFGMNQSLDGYLDHMAFSPSPALFRHCPSKHVEWHVYIPSDGGRVTDDSPGTLRLQLEASASGLRVLDGDARERGRIDVELPKIRYAIRRGRDHIGTLSARSFVLRRHAAIGNAVGTDETGQPVGRIIM